MGIYLKLKEPKADANSNTLNDKVTVVI